MVKSAKQHADIQKWGKETLLSHDSWFSKSFFSLVSIVIDVDSTDYAISLKAAWQEGQQEGQFSNPWTEKFCCY